MYLYIIYYLVRHPRRFYSALSRRGKRWALRGLIAFLIVLIAVPATFWYQARHAKAAWWNEDWMYRQKMQLTNSSGSTLSDFQMMITIDTAALISAGKMQTTTCADIRFTDSNGQMLNYWIEENNPGCGNAATKVWVKVPSVYNGTNATSVYMYYGNPSASATQDGNKVFDFFDDFSGNLSKWNSPSCGSMSTASGVMQWNGTSTGHCYVTPAANPNLTGIETKARTRYLSSSAGTLYWGVNTRTSGSNRYVGALYPTSSVCDARANTTSLGTAACTISSDTWYFLASSANSTAIKTFQNDTEKVSVTNASYSSGGAGMDFYHSGAGSGTYETDWIFSRKLASADPTASAGSEEIGPGPAGYWKFDEGQGGTTQDSSSNNNDGTITGAAWKPESECVSGKCLRFNGSPDRITISDPANGALDFGSSKSFSISSWIKLQPNAANYNGVIGKCGQDNSCAGYELFTSGNGTGVSLRLTWIDGPQYGISVSGSFNFADNKYHHVVATLNRTNNYGYIYVDGKQIASADMSTVGNLDNTQSLTTGLNGAGYWSGFIDEPKIYPYARTTDQIKQDYNAGLAGQSTSSGSSVSIGSDSPQWMSDGLVGHWKMDETSGTTVADASGNGNTGTLTNAQETGTSDASGNSVTTMVDTDGSLSSNNDAYNNMILRFTAACGSITSGTERIISDYTGSPHTFTVATLASVPDSCAYEIRHQAGGKFGNGLGFERNDDYVSIANSASLNPSGSTMTMSAWVKPSSLPGSTHQRLINKNSTTGYMLNIYSTYAEVYFGGQNVTGPTLTAGEWVHLVAIAGNGRVKIYKNGTQTTDTALTGTIDGGSSILALASNSSPGSYFGGNMDDVRVYNRALSPDEVKQLSEWGPGPAGWWKMDEKSGGTAYDSSGNGNNGTLTNMDTSSDWVQGKYGNALDFDGSNDYVVTSVDEDINPKYNLTIEAWANIRYMESGTWYHELVDQSGGYGKGLYAVYYGRPNEVAFCLNINATARCIYSGTGYFDNWHHYAGSYDGATMKFYVDGNLISTGSYTGDITDYSAAPVKIGGGVSGRYTQGSVDDARIYNYVRSPAQIQQDMEGGVAAAQDVSSGPLPDPVAYWKFEEGQGNNFTDSGPNNLTLTNSGTTWSNEGKYGKALDFTNDSASIADNDALDFGTDNFSVSFWAYHRDYTYPKSVVSMQKSTNAYLDGNPGWEIGNSYSASGYQVALNDGTNKYSGAITMDVGSRPPDIQNKWAHIAFVFSRSTGKIKIYINGKKQSAEADISAVTGSINNAIGFKIGQVSGWQIDGLVDEVKLFRAALSDDQVKQDMNQSASLVMGSGGMSSAGVPSDSASQEYCVPGDATSCVGPIAEWKMDDGSGTTTNDTSGNGRNLSFTNSPTWTQGKFGKALDFDNDDYASNDWADFSLGPQTIEFWMKADVINASWRDLVGTTLNTDSNRFHLQTGDNSIVFYSVLGACGTIDSDVVPVAGQWYHVAGTTDGTTMKIYINGQQKKSAACATASYTTTGIWVGGTTEDFDGQIDQVRVFSYARTPAQIAWDFNRGDPVGWWRMDEGEGDVAHDSTKNGNNGTLTSMDPPNDWVAGKFGKALDFDGSNDYIDLGDPTAADTTGAFSLSAWIKPAVLSGETRVIGDEDSEYCGYPCGGYSLDTSGSSLVFTFGDSALGGNSGNWDVASASNILSTGQWQHVLATWDGTTGSNGMKLYLNGSLKAQATAVQTSAYHGTPNTGIGSHQRNDGTWNQFFNGQIDDVRVYNYALSTEQVKQIMNNGGAVRYGE